MNNKTDFYLKPQLKMRGREITNQPLPPPLNWLGSDGPVHPWRRSGLPLPTREPCIPILIGEGALQLVLVNTEQKLLKKQPLTLLQPVQFWTMPKMPDPVQSPCIFTAVITVNTNHRLAGYGPSGQGAGNCYSLSTGNQTCIPLNWSLPSPTPPTPQGKSSRQFVQAYQWILV